MDYPLAIVTSVLLLAAALCVRQYFRSAESVYEASRYWLRRRFQEGDNSYYVEATGPDYHTVDHLCQRPTQEE